MTNGDEGSNGTALINLKKRALWSYPELGMKENAVWWMQSFQKIKLGAEILIVQLHELERFVCQQSGIGWIELSYTCSYYSLEILSNWVCAGADNLAANFSRELADYIIYIIDVSGGDKIPRKGGPGITQADLLVCVFWYSLLQLLWIPYLLCVPISGICMWMTP